MLGFGSRAQQNADECRCQAREAQSQNQTPAGTIQQNSRRGAQAEHSKEHQEDPAQAAGPLAPRVRA